MKLKVKILIISVLLTFVTQALIADNELYLNKDHLIQDTNSFLDHLDCLYVLSISEDTYDFLYKNAPDLNTLINIIEKPFAQTVEICTFLSENLNTVAPGFSFYIPMDQVEIVIKETNHEPLEASFNKKDGRYILTLNIIAKNPNPNLSLKNSDIKDAISEYFSKRKLIKFYQKSLEKELLDVQCKIEIGNDIIKAFVKADLRSEIPSTIDEIVSNAEDACDQVIKRCSEIKPTHNSFDPLKCTKNNTIIELYDMNEYKHTIEKAYFRHSHEGLHCRFKLELGFYNLKEGHITFSETEWKILKAVRKYYYPR
ncbi:MAG: hypothetical protein ABIA04_02205 [Pseudomonadota bacterium]